jgi:hypothetical protein
MSCFGKAALTGQQAGRAVKNWKSFYPAGNFPSNTNDDNW